MEFIKNIKASNILSFGPDGLDLPKSEAQQADYSENHEPNNLNLTGAIFEKTEGEYRAHNRQNGEQQQQSVVVNVQKTVRRGRY